MYPNLPTPPGLGVTFHTYGLMLTLAFAAAFVVSSRRMGRVGVDPDHMLPLLVLAIVFGILGGWAQHALMSTTGGFGMAVLGGIIGGSVAGVSYLVVRRLPLLKVMDVVFPGVVLAQAIGRVGCFFAGCCHGRACPVPETGSLTGGFFPGGEIVTVQGFPWVAFRYHEHVGVGNLHGVPLYPTQSWETLGNLALFALLSWVWLRHRRFDGLVVGLWFIGYPVLRAVIETFRGDEIRGTDWFGLTTAQVTGIPLVLLGVAIIAYGALVGGLADESQGRRKLEKRAQDLLSYD